MSTRKILLVDDSRSARYALRLLLQKHDCEVDTAESAESALEKIKESLPDAIFMDHLMPGMNGFEALDLLKADPRTQAIPVVMCTSNDDPPYQQQAREKGALGILPKPATPEKLATMLERIDAAMQAQPTAAAPVEATPSRPEEVTPVAAPQPALEETPAVLAASAAMDLAPIEALVNEALARFLERDVQPLVETGLDQRLAQVKSELGESLLAHSAEQLARWMETEMARVREEVTAHLDQQIERIRAESPDPVPQIDLAGKLEDDVRELRADLVKMETEHAQAVIQKISRDVLPDLIKRRTDELEQRIFDQMDLRVGEISDRLLDDLPHNPQLVRRLSEAAETAAEHKAAEIAMSHAQQIAETSAEAKAGEVTDSLIHSAESALRRMYLMAALAAGAGILSSLVVFFLVR